jgi:hypothetical protein
MKEVVLTQGFKCLVDDRDYDMVSEFKWHVLNNKKANTKYAVRMETVSINPHIQKTIFMHRVIMGVTDPKTCVDHINGDGLDTRSNLRLSNKSQNGANRKPKKGGSSKYLGVCKMETVFNGKYYVKLKKPWHAQIRENGKIHNLGRYSKEEDAAMAYNEAAKKYHGEFARLNILT